MDGVLEESAEFEFVSRRTGSHQEGEVMIMILGRLETNSSVKCVYLKINKREHDAAINLVETATAHLRLQEFDPSGSGRNSTMLFAPSLVPAIFGCTPCYLKGCGHRASWCFSHLDVLGNKS